MIKIAVIGLGYVGLPLARLFATKYNVIGFDINEARVALMKQGIDPPYSCTVGVCTTCRAKVTAGKMHMLEREGLSDAEIAEGYVLTCQSVPRSSEITLKYE